MDNILRIKSPAVAASDVEIWLGDKKLTGVKSIQINMDVGEINRAKLEFIGPLDIEIEAMFEFETPDLTYKEMSAFHHTDGATFFNAVAKMANA